MHVTAHEIENAIQKTMNKSWLGLLLVVVMGCQPTATIRADQDLAEGWDRVGHFSIPPKTNGRYDLFIHLRNDNSYPYANIFLIARLKTDSTTLHTDTLEYAMAAASGKWLGVGFSEVKESKLVWRENIELSDSLSYHIEIEHAQRAQGQVEGHKNLPGILSVGYSLETKTE